MPALDLAGSAETAAPALGEATRVLEVPQGGLVVSAAPDLELATTLGSCVSICLHAEAGRVGGMNHVYQTVRDRAGGNDAVVAELERLVNEFMRRGHARADLTARLAGGAHVLPHGRDYGLAIAEAALDYLAREGIPVVGVSIGGNRARRVRYRPATGRLNVSLLAPAERFGPPPPQSDGNAPEMF